MKVGRNELCPCGSGLKVKRCCGVDGIRARAQLAAETAAELFELATVFPRYRPAGAAFEAWAERAPEEPTEATIDAGLAALDAAERSRIADGFARDYPDVWKSVLADFGNDELAVEIVVDGAVIAGVVERHRPLDSVLRLLESEPELGDDAALALALALDPSDLWSVIESGTSSEALEHVPDDERLLEAATEVHAEQIATPWHRRRLEALVDRLCARLSAETDYPRGRAVLETAAERFARDEAVRRRLAGLLLLYSFDSLYAAAA